MLIIQRRPLFKEAAKFSVKCYGMDELVSHNGVGFIDFKKMFQLYLLTLVNKRTSKE